GGLVVGAARAVGALGGDRVESVYDGEDTGFERYGLAFQPLRVAGAVPVLVMVAHDGEGVPEEAYVLQHPVAKLRVAAHLLPFVLIERPRFAEYGVGYAYLAHVVQQR